jgi:predicted Na+-dependent transporter
MVNVLQVLLGLLVALLMLGLGATVRGKDIKRVKTKWKAPLLGFL